MALTKPTMDVDIITVLATTSADRGLTEDEFKAKFDETPAAIKTYLNDTLTAELDTALGLKATLAAPTFTGTVVLPSTTSIGTVSNTEIGYLDNVTSAIQTQLNAKARKTLVTTEATNATPTPNVDNCDIHTITALAATATFGTPAGTPYDGQKLIIRIKDNGTARTLAWNAIYRAIGVTLPLTTVISKTLYVGFIFNNTDTKWDCLAVSLEA